MSTEKKLIIVESPGKIKTIRKFLDCNDTVKASVGHIMDLDKKSLSIDVNKKFKPTYVILLDKKKVVSELKKIAIDKIVYLASDMDLEGEFISESIRDILKLKNCIVFLIDYPLNFLHNNILDFVIYNVHSFLYF